MLLERAESATDKITQRLGVEDERNATCVLRQCPGRSGPGVQYEWCQLQNSRVQEMLVMGSLLSYEAGTMSPMRHRMNKAMTATRAEMHVYKKNPDIHCAGRRSWQTHCMAVRADAWK